MMVHSLCWSAQANMLAGLQESRLSVWYYPAVIFVDKELLTKTILQKESPYVLEGARGNRGRDGQRKGRGKGKGAEWAGDGIDKPTGMRIR